MNRQIPIIVKGVTLYPITEEVIKKYKENPNYVILIADISLPTIPVYYQRFADYIDKASLDRIGLCIVITEDERIYNELTT